MKVNRNQVIIGGVTLAAGIVIGHNLGVCRRFFRELDATIATPLRTGRWFAYSTIPLATAYHLRKEDNFLLLAVQKGEMTAEEALRKAAKDGDVRAVRVLLQRGADVNTGDANTITPLIAATHSRHTEIVERLLAVDGIDLNATDKEGRTALGAVSAYLTDNNRTKNGGEIAKMLLKKGALVDDSSKKNIPSP